MFLLIPTGQTRPSILEKNKDKQYHIDFARYCIGQANNNLHNAFIEKIKTNKRFYKGDQWIDQEDVELFLKDDTSQDRNRLKLVDNIIRPMVEQYRGNAIRMGINFRAKSVSPQSVDRRQTKLAETLYYSNQANTPGNPFAEEIKKRYPVGKDDGDTTSQFNDLYSDRYLKKMNGLCEFVSKRNSFQDKQVRIAEELAFSGLGVMKYFERAGHQQWKITPSGTFFFDRSAVEYDLTDAAYMGEIIEMTPSEIFETWQDIDPADREAIELYSKNQANVPNGKYQVGSSNNLVASGKVPIYLTYWKDGQVDEFGYVIDEFGYEYLTKINYIREGDTEPKYTDKDLIKSKSAKAKKLLGDKLKRRLHYETVRVAALIPSEILSSTTNSNEKKSDVVLEFGISPYQDTESLEFEDAKFPYKAYCWGYVDGEILSPIDDAIDPQRFINRIWSVAENQINNSRGSGSIIDSSMVVDQDETERNMNQSKTVYVNAKGRGIQNAVGQYDGTIKSGTMVMFNIIDAMKSSTKQITGLNEAINGESTGSDQLVGVTQLMIQRGSLMQEPFYNAITMVYKQCYQAICGPGKRIYSDSQRNVSIAVGDEGLEMFKITRDMNLEDFRMFVKRENADDVLINAANQMLMQFKQFQMLDDERISELWGRSSPDEVANALRAYSKEKKQLQRMGQEKEQAEQQQVIASAQDDQAKQEYMINEAEAKMDIKDINDKKFEMQKENLKALSKIGTKNKVAENLIIQNAKNLEKQTI